jgi:uncharacterized OB-fold protein
MPTGQPLDTVSAVSEQVAVRDGLFILDDVPALIGGRCRHCDSVCFPLQEICPYCSHESVKPIELSRSGRLWAWTAVNAPPPGYEGSVPYGFGVVELPEGVRIVTRLTESDPSNLEPGQPMELVLVPLNGENDPQILTYAFAPASAS